MTATADKTLERSYNYVDKSGNVLYQVLRWNPKSFSQRAADGKGGWKNSLDGVERVPFKLPELLRSIARGETIYVCEGEKDCDALYKLGLMTTTNAQGAKYKWPDSWASYFEDAVRVVVIADNDKPGLAAAEQRAGVIARVCPDTRIIAALPGEGVKDASDWIAAGGTTEKLEELAEAAPRAKATKPRAANDLTPVIMPVMEQWRELTHRLIEDGRIDVLTPGGPLRDNGSRSMQCPMPGHEGKEDTKPSAWIGQIGTPYIWGCDQHGQLLLWPFLVASGWARDKEDAQRKVTELGYSLPVSPSRDLVSKMDPAAAKLALAELISKRSDIANGRWFVKLFASSVRFNRDRQAWYVWDGKRWLLDRGTDIEKYAKRAVDELLRQAVKLALDDEKRQILIRYALQCGTVKAVTNMLKMARSEDEIECRETDFDADPYLLNVRNGTIDLRTGELREHRQEDFITRCVDVDYDPNVRNDEWERTLLQVFCDDPDTVRYFQRAMGYSITGCVNEECFFLMYGTGRNGKGTLLESVEALFDEYVKTTPFNTFQKQKNTGGAATPELAELAGARIVVASEAPEDARFALDRLKGLTGGDRVNARFLHLNPFTYKPQFKIWIAVNYRPKANADDVAFWERVKAVPFNRTFKDEERDKTLKTRLKASLQGILTWVVEGAVVWHREGLGTCKAVEESTQDYLAENDHFTRWLTECCVTGDAKMVATTKALSDSYLKWVGENDISQFEWLNPTAFGLKLTRLGFEKDGTQKKRTGIGLRAVDEERLPESEQTPF